MDWIENRHSEKCCKPIGSEMAAKNTKQIGTRFDISNSPTNLKDYFLEKAEELLKRKEALEDLHQDNLKKIQEKKPIIILDDFFSSKSPVKNDPNDEVFQGFMADHVNLVTYESIAEIYKLWEEFYNSMANVMVDFKPTFDKWEKERLEYSQYIKNILLNKKEFENKKIQIAIFEFPLPPSLFSNANDYLQIYEEENVPYLVNAIVQTIVLLTKILETETQQQDIELIKKINGKAVELRLKQPEYYVYDTFEKTHLLLKEQKESLKTKSYELTIMYDLFKKNEIKEDKNFWIDVAAKYDSEKIVLMFINLLEYEFDNLIMKIFGPEFVLTDRNIPKIIQLYFNLGMTQSATLSPKAI